MSLQDHGVRWGGFAAAAFAFVAVGLVPAQAGSFRVVYDFTGSDGDAPESGLVVDSIGRLIGSTPVGGSSFSGVVYRLTPPAQPGTTWTEEVLYDFAAAGNKTSEPFGPVTLQSDGTIFGTAAGGGKGGGGIVYRLDESGGQWGLTALHSFNGGSDGGDPFSGVTIGPSGLLYGSTIQDGPYGVGTIYEASSTGTQTAYRTVAQPLGTYGASRPSAIGSNRLVYTLTLGGANGQGAVIAAQETAPGHLRMTTLYSFASSGDAAQPATDSPLLPGPHRVLYGCAAGGAYGIGAVYQLTPPALAGAAWTEKVLYSFGAQPSDPDGSYGDCYINAGPTGQIVGVATRGGAYEGGALFEIDPPAQPGGLWTESVLHNFNARNNGFFLPEGVPVRIGNTYYGTAMFGGMLDPISGGDGGGVWSYTP